MDVKDYSRMCWMEGWRWVSESVSIRNCYDCFGENINILLDLLQQRVQFVSIVRYTNNKD